jgi:hypothetical protein
MSIPIRRRINEIAHRLGILEEAEVRRVLLEAVRRLGQSGHPTQTIDDYLTETERTTFVPQVDQWLAARVTTPEATPRVV